MFGYNMGIRMRLELRTRRHTGENSLATMRMRMRRWAYDDNPWSKEDTAGMRVFRGSGA